MTECAVDARCRVIEGKSTYAAYAVTQHKAELPSTVCCLRRSYVELTGLARTVDRHGNLFAVKPLHRFGKILRRGDALCTDAGDQIALSDAGILGRRALAAFRFNALHPCDHHAVREHFNAQRLAARDKLLRHCHGAHR